MALRSATEIRKAFIDFFAERGHRVVKSYALIPPSDPTLFFVNAGMVQFKDVFVGERQVDYSTATSSQKCLRVSGKHNDLENVGRTARHHTFFEMLGNFSFGDYFKKDAVAYAWEFLTKVAELPADKLHVSVYPDDEEAYALWRDMIGIPVERIHRDPDNFWSMGDTGPCGPCSEIHIDLGPAMSGGKVDVPYGDPEGDERYLELWNLVFMQFDRSADGVLTPLPKPSIDTGAGLERLTAVLQGKLNNYDTDLFMPIIEQVAKKAGVTYRTEPEIDVALRVIADHSRAAANLIADGIYPDNEGRGYVLRRVMRRAIRFGRMIGLTDPFLVDTTQTVIDILGDVYPELREGADTIRRIVLQEETRFGRTINAGLKRLGEEIAHLGDGHGRVLDGRVAFELYDTHGFPPDLTALILAEKGFSYDHEGYTVAMEEQRERARAASKFGTGDLSSYQDLVEGGITPTTFLGYDRDEAEATVLALLVDGAPVPRAAAGQRVEIVLDQTPFYAESGGQVGDSGVIVGFGNEPARLTVNDTQKPFGDIFVHVAVIDDGVVELGDRVAASIDTAARNATRKNHSATHLLHDALRKVLGDHVRQRGSMVGPARLRFDFSHTGAMSDEEIRQVELLVNAHVVANEPVSTDLMSMDAAMGKGAIAFFEEKYGDEVRVLSVGSESVELCGGTHVRATGDIGLMKIVSEAAISSGVRRVEAVTGMGAVEWVQQRDAVLRAAADALNVGVEHVVDRVGKLLDDRKELDQQLQDAKLQARRAEATASVQNARLFGDVKAAVVRMDGVPGKDIRALAESLREQLGSGAVLVAGKDGAKVSLVVAATKDLAKRVHAGKLVGQLAEIVGGRGGGKPDVAQAGGADASRIGELEPRFYELMQGALEG
ncbi:MAG: alanine--tRNA ligase [Deltaproteobacteria bacterium]|nr:MAG: alanine--tRNA ligase [Deltaproteobacteria bacterium]